MIRTALLLAPALLALAACSGESGETNLASTNDLNGVAGNMALPDLVNESTNSAVPGESEAAAPPAPSPTEAEPAPATRPAPATKAPADRPAPRDRTATRPAPTPTPTPTPATTCTPEHEALGHCKQ